MFDLFCLQSLTEDVTRQMEREKTLQQRYAELQAKLEELHAALQNVQEVQQQANTVDEVIENEQQEEPNIESAYDGEPQNISEVLAS